MTFTLTLAHILAAIVAAAGGGGTLGALVALGAFHRWLKPAIRAEIGTYEGEAATQETRKLVIRGVIDDQTARDDGLIRRHTRDHEARLTAAIESVRETNAALVEEFAQFRGLLSAFMDHMPDRRTPVDLGRAPAPQMPRAPLSPRHPTDPGKGPR